MKPPNLVLRCYAVKKDGHWEAFCIDLCLAAQADSFKDAKRLLDAQIRSYITEALTIDRDHAEALLTRRAPLKQVLTFKLYHLLSRLGVISDGIRKSFFEALPVNIDRHAKA